MLFTLIDVILIAIVVFFVALGFIMGFWGSLGMIFGIIAGFWAATNFFQLGAQWLAPLCLGNMTMASIVSFLVIFSLANRLVALVFWLSGKILSILSFIPLAKSLSRLGGLILGLVEGILLLGLALYTLAKFATGLPWLINALDGSRVAHFLVAATQLVTQIIF